MKNNEYSVLLNSAKTKKNINVEMAVGVDLSANKKLFNGQDTGSVIDSYETYLSERKESNRFRLILNINPYCSNVLFNPITEIVKYEGSDSAICINFREMSAKDFHGDVIGKGSGDTSNDFLWNGYNAVRDTQLSNDTNGFTYHCGINIFNNHILRNKTFKSVNFNEKYKDSQWNTVGDAYSEMSVAEKVGYENQLYYNIKIDGQLSPCVYGVSFNTIDDYMRDRHGVPIVKSSYVLKKDPPTVERDIEKYNIPIHLYQKYDVHPFRESIEVNLKEKNGWFGFSNPSIFNSIMLNPRESQETTTQVDKFEINKTNLDFCEQTEESVSILANSETIVLTTPAITPRINKTINNRLACEFIDMYPERELFSFTPNYNSYRKRLERNWDYCLTYPFESVYEVGGVDFLIRDGRKTPALKVDRFDENITNDDNSNIVVIYSICQHGLKAGDYINLYRRYDGENELLYTNAEVIDVYDKYTFSIYKTEADISMEWVNLNMYSDEELRQGIVIEENGGVERKYSFNNSTFTFGDYPVCASKWVNVDDTCQNLFFVKVVNNIECEYYIRKFRRIPNFKFSDVEINDYNVNKNDDLINKYNNPANKYCDFENHISKIGFASTNYSDDVVQIIYTDNIDTSYLRDNLGRPLSDIYLTIVKRNKGYKEWYGIDDEQNISASTVEYSHCFGKNKAQFLLSDYYRSRTIDNAEDVRDITVSRGGLNNGSEIIFDENREFFGDLCCYSPADCKEQSIQNVMCRFNTVQREITSYNAKQSVLSAFTTFKYDEIAYDDNTTLPSVITEIGPRAQYSSAYTAYSSAYTEGYYYQMHYRIPVKDVSTTLSSDQALKYDIYSMLPEYDESNTLKGIKVRTQEPNGFTIDERLMIYDVDENEIYHMSVSEIKTITTFICNIYDEFGHDRNQTIEGIINNYINNHDTSYLRRFKFLKKNEGTPSYAKVIRDGSCRYYWRNIVSNGIEDEDIVYPFTNGAFYVAKTFNFFLRRQDPHEENLSYVKGENFAYTPEGEVRSKYYIDVETDSYESGEIDECSWKGFNPLKDVAGETSLRYVISKSTEKINNVLR